MSLPRLDAQRVKAMIEQAFADTPHPGDHDLVRSRGDEPAIVEDLFRGRHDWRELDPEMLDRAGAASPSALSFFSDGAFRFYLPAFLVADLEGRLRYSDPLFFLYHGLDQRSRHQPVRVPNAGVRTWWEVQQRHLAGFTPPEAAAVVAYLRFKVESAGLVPMERDSVSQALANYWQARAEGQDP